MAFISKRKYIRWGDEPAEERTSTLVLTSREKRYVDIRVYVSEPSEELSNNARDGRELGDLEWASAGTSQNTAPSYDPLTTALKVPAHTVWTHWVDSWTLDEVKDEGYMYPQPDGTVLEKGEMVKRETGRLTPYEEVWQDYDLEITGADEKVVEVILSCEDEGNGVKGMVARIGGWIQGVLRMRRSITAVRWQWVVVEGSAGEWKKVFAAGSGVIPCEALFSGGGAYPRGINAKVGMQVTAEDGMKWICSEAFLR